MQTNYYGAGTPAGYASMLGASAAGGSQDPQRAWDRAQLSAKLADMSASIEATNQALAFKDTFVANAPGVGGGVHEGGSGASVVGGPALSLIGYDVSGNPVYAPSSSSYEGAAGMGVDGAHGGYEGGVAGMDVPLNPGYLDPASLPIVAGWLHRKGGRDAIGFGGGRSWRERFCRLEGADLVFYASAEDMSPKSRFAIDAATVVTAEEKAHRNKNVKNDFDVTNGSGDSVSLYCETEQESAAWITTITAVAGALQEAAFYADPAAQAALAQAQAQAHAMAAQQQFFTQMQGDSASMVGGAEQGETMAAPAPQSAPAPAAPPQAGNATPVAAAGAAAYSSEEADEAQVHTAFGPGLYEAVRGEPAYFYIQANDSQGLAKGVGGDVFNVTIECDDLHFELFPVDNQDGTYYVEYTPTRAGDYQLRVTYGGHDVYGSPFHPIVSKAPTAPSHCKVVGEGAGVARVGTTNTFTIVARDQFDDERGVGGDNFEIEIHGPGLANPIIDHGNGLYTVSYDVDESHKAYRAAADSGFRVPVTLEVHVSLNNEGFTYPRPIAGSPFRPRMVLPSDADSIVQTALAQLSVSPGKSRAAGALLPAATKAALPAEALAAVEAELAARLAEVDEMRRRVEADRAVVEAQMARMSELGLQVKRDSERLAAEARALRGVVSPAGAATTDAGTDAEADVEGGDADTATQLGWDGASVVTGLTGLTGPTGITIPSTLIGGTAGTAARGRSDLAPSSPAAAAAPGAGLSAEAPADLFDPAVMALFDRYKRPLHALWSYYSDLAAAAAGEATSAAGLDARRFVDLFCDFDIAPTFLTRRELKGVYGATARAHAGPGVAAAAAGAGDADGLTLRLPYAAFVEALGRSALAALSKPAFQHLYPAARDKVSVLLEMWALADYRKLQEIQRRPRAAEGGAKSKSGAGAKRK